MALPADTTSRTILLGFGGVLIALMFFLVWVGRYANQQEIALAQTILRQEVSFSVADLRDCMSEYRLDGLALSGRWSGDADSPNGTQGFNHASGLRVNIHDEGEQRLVEIATPGARPLRPDEREQINRCLAGRR